MRTLVLLPLLLGTACNKRVEIDSARATAELDKRWDSALETPAVEQSIEKLWDGIAADPAVGKNGEKIMAALGEDPLLQGAMAKFMEQLGQEPSMRKMVQQIIKEHPRATEDQIGDLIEKRISQVTEGPAFDKAFDKAFDALMKRPEVAKMLNTLGEKVADNPHVDKAINAGLDKIGGDEAWGARVTAWNGGKVPDKQRATDLVLEKLFPVDRLSRFYVKVYGLPSVKKELAAGTAELLGAPAFQKLTAQLVRTLADDALFRKRATETMLVLFEPSDAALERATRQLLEAPVVPKAISTWGKGLMADASLALIGDKTLRAMVAAPDLQACISELLAGPDVK
jgi:hypothetical protein